MTPHLKKELARGCDSHRNNCAQCSNLVIRKLPKNHAVVCKVGAISFIDYRGKITSWYERARKCGEFDSCKE